MFTNSTHHCVKYSIITVSLVLFIRTLSFASPVTDSLLKVLVQTKTPQEKARLNNKLAYLFISNQNEEGLRYAIEALELAQNHSLDDAKADALDNIGYHYAQKGFLEKAYEHYLQAKNININLAREKSLISQFYALADIHYKKNQYNQALQLALEALKRAEKHQDEGYIGATTNLLGLVYADLNQYKLSIKYLTQALRIEQKYSRHVNIAFLLSNIAGIYLDLEQPDSALKLYKEGIELLYADESARLDARFLHAGMAETYFKHSKHERALNQILTAIKQNEEVNDQEGLARDLALAARIYLALGKPEKAIQSAKSSEKIAETIGLKFVLCEVYQVLADIYREQGALEKVIEYQKLVLQLKESIFQETNAKGLAEANAIYELDKKEKEIRLKDQEADLLTQKAENESLWKRSFIAIALLMLVVAAIIWARYNDKRKSNGLLLEKNNQINEKNTALEAKNQKITQQSEEIRAQRDSIDSQNKELESAFIKLTSANDLLKKNHHQITASINYARRIQDAMLPHIDDIRESIPELFILHRARDIVSGDFYWFAQKKQQLSYNDPKNEALTPHNMSLSQSNTGLMNAYNPAKVSEIAILVVADCTGHGVPGAFMSMAGEAYLNQIVNVQGVHSPGQILSLLHQNIFKALRQDETDNKDGMDITIALIDLTNKTLCFAGAKNPLFYVCPSQPEGTLIKGNKYSVGGKTTGLDANFEEHNLPIDEETMFYMYTDGYEDQFGGGEPPRKFLGKNMRKLLTQNANRPLAEQKEALAIAIDAWQNPSNAPKQTQLDDILVVGFKLQP